MRWWQPANPKARHAPLPEREGLGVGRPARATPDRLCGNRPTPYPSLSGRGEEGLHRHASPIPNKTRKSASGLPIRSPPPSRAGPRPKPRAHHAPSLEGRGWGWVGQLEPRRIDCAETNPPPAPPFQGGEKRVYTVTLAQSQTKPGNLPQVFLFAPLHHLAQDHDRSLERTMPPPWKGGVGGGSASLSHAGSIVRKLTHPSPSLPGRGAAAYPITPTRSSNNT